MKSTKNNIHSGHRKRLRETVLKFGFENLNDYQKMEYILTLAAPRKDVNDVAHLLIDEFGSVSKVLEVDPELLSEFAGIGKATAEAISILPQISLFYVKDRYLRNPQSVNTYGMLHKYLKHIYFGCEIEKVVMIIISKDYEIKSHFVINEGEFDSVKIDVAKLTKILSGYKAKSVIIAHNHPLGSPFPSEADIQTNTRLVSLFNNLNVRLHDNVIFTDKELYSFKMNNSVKLND